MEEIMWQFQYSPWRKSQGNILRMKNVELYKLKEIYLASVHF